jgi:hypothetical protein
VVVYTGEDGGVVMSVDVVGVFVFMFVFMLVAYGWLLWDTSTQCEGAEGIVDGTVGEYGRV